MVGLAASAESVFAADPSDTDSPLATAFEAGFGSAWRNVWICQHAVVVPANAVD